jgi:hypothetical protein
MSRVARIGALALVAAALHVAPAFASHTVQYGIQDDAWLLDGSGTLQQRLDQVQSLGVTTVRFTLHWDQIAPRKPKRALASTDPAYRWSGADALLKGLRARGIQPLVTLYGSPRWSNGGKNPNAAPKSATAFADFAYAAAKRYPFVRKWAIWNEPNQRLYLAQTSPALYVTRLLNPGYAAIHRANRRAVVAGGVSAPRGNSGGFGPLAWVRGLAAAHAKLDAYAHNPYATRPLETPLKGACSNCDVISLANLDRLEAQLRRSFGPKPIWLTEYGYQTNPPDRVFGVSPALQALYVSESAMRVYQLPYVAVLIQYLVRDEPELDRFQSGLESTRGVRKPAYAAFRFPLSEAGRSGTRASLWGQIRPGSGVRTYRLQVSSGGVWRWYGPTSRTNRLGFYTTAVSVPTGTLVRVWSPQQRAYGWPLVIR